MLTEKLRALLVALTGDERRNSLEQRLFNSLSLLNAGANLGGAAFLVSTEASLSSVVLHGITGLAFLTFYYWSRVKRLYRPYFWPFIVLIAAFLSYNVLINAGSQGGAHYYLIPALVIAVILARGSTNRIGAFLLFGLVAAGLFLTEQRFPGWFTPYANPNERFADVSLNFLFVQLFTGVLVLVLARNLNQERRKSDQLLLNVLPASIAEELKMTEKVEPRTYHSASVMFTDFVGFTKVAEKNPPQQLINELDRCFAAFDQVIKKHNLEKIKTIGDSYMAVGGIPEENQTHAIDCVLAALQIEAIMDARHKAITATLGGSWEIRLGINSGSLVAGVIGREKFAYDVWGDTVNTASRLESSGVPGRINISKSTYDLVREFFDCEYRGKIPAKNKGEIEMYFANRIKAELSGDSGGREPNSRFRDLYNQLEVQQTGASAGAGTPGTDVEGLTA